MIFALSIPKDTPSSTQRVTLDGTEYVISLEWSSRGGWYLGLSDGAGSVIFSPRKLSVDWNLLSCTTDPRRPRGGLACADMSGRGEKPGYESLGVTHQIVYFTEDELS